MDVKGVSPLYRVACLLGFAALLSACSNKTEAFDQGAFEEVVSKHRIGSDVDQWIEMKNVTGEWERTGLIFGYLGDADECAKAIEGLKRANYAREYRCVPAN